ncbi:MAG TPA: serine hydrolase [Acidobacteriota bacterium]
MTSLRRFVLLSSILLASVAGWTNPRHSAAEPSGKQASYYYPPRDRWQHKHPSEVGMDEAALEKAVAYAKGQESKVPPDFSTQVETFGALLGPLPKERGPSNGLILRHGYIVAEWGDTRRVDPTYSVAKSFLSTLLGLALDGGLISSVNDPVGRYIHDGGYDSPHNAKVTWHHHAQQTSEWEGVMWGKSHDFVGIEQFGQGRREPRALQEPGSFYEYNDVRINRLALSLLRVWKTPLPEVLKKRVMDPIGASDTWQYHGYFNSDVVINGKMMKSVTGGTRWGGGLWINSLDEARFGYLFLRKGNWKGRQIVSNRWVEMATTPGPVGPDYGYLWWLNTKRRAWPDAPASAFAARGYGSNAIWMDPEHDLVIVWRWHQGGENEFFRQVIAAVRR